jgi:hypothetical protein
MSPFAVVIILVLTVLFALLSFVPFLSNPRDVDSLDTPTTPRPKTAH